MGSLNVDFLFTNILLEGTTDICANTFFEYTERVEDLSKIEFKELLSLTTKESYFILNGKLYKQVDRVAIGSRLGATLAVVLFLCFEKNWLQNCLSDFKPQYYRQDVDDILSFVYLTRTRRSLLKFS